MDGDSLDPIDTVNAFKAQCKEYIRSCSFDKAISLCSIKYESFQDLQLREEVTLIHWWTKVFYKAGDLRSMTTLCLTKVNTMVNLISTCPYSKFKQADNTTPMSQQSVDECFAELLYLKRQIDTKIQYKDAERALRIFREEVLNKPENKENFLITKYYIKLLLEYDEYQLGMDPKTGFQQLLLAEKLNKEILVKKHSYKS